MYLKYTIKKTVFCYKTALFIVGQVSRHGSEGHLELFANFNDVPGGQEEPVLSLLVPLRQLEGVAVLDVLGDVPVVRGPARQAPQAEHLLGGAGRVGHPLLSLHLGADASRQLGELGSAGVLVVPVTALC